MPRRVFVLALAICASLSAVSHAQTNPSTTVLSATPSTINEGESVALTVAVQVASGDATPTGTVQVTLSGAALFSVTLSTGVAEHTASSTGIVPGTYDLVANYSGDAHTVASQSAAVPVTISVNPTATTLTVVPANVLNSRTVSATANISAGAGKEPLTGTVTFSVGATEVGTASVVKGTATITSDADKLSDGAYQLVATYNGDKFNGPSKSAAQPLTVFGNTTTVFGILPEVVTIGSPATITVTVVGDSGITPTGTMSFYLGQQLLGQGPLVNGSITAEEPTTGDPQGSYTVTAKYSGDANNDPSKANTLVHLQDTAANYSLTPVGAAIATGGTAQFTVTPPSSAKLTWYVNGIAGGTAAAGTISSTGLYTAPTGHGPVAVQITVSKLANPEEYAPTVPVYVVAPGSVGPSNNSQVATYSIQAPQGGQMDVEFGLNTNYGLNTWQQPTPVGGGTQTMLVAGMMAPATYHMRADVDFGNGLVYYDADQTFATTLVFPPPSTAVLTQAPGMTPQPGIEVVNDPGNHIYGYDVNGNLIWGLTFPAGVSSPSFFQPIKQMANGHLLIQISPENAFPIDGSVVPSGTTIALFEMLLDGTIVREFTIAQLNAAVAASGYVDGQGNLPTLLDMHHEVTINPVTGHWLIVANTIRTEPETDGPESVLGDVILDVDPNNNYAVGWVWNEFDHLDVTRHPDSVQDWTHTNALIYSQTDHDLLVSMRYQNWIVKVDYDDGAGSGDIIWHFGYQGDFTLVNGVSPQDWQFGQHEPAFESSTTAGVYGLTMMDNGLQRIFAPGYTCMDGTATPCHYSRAPQFTIDETAMTATLGPVMPYENYSYFGGNGEILPNGDAHAAFCTVADAGDSEGHGVIEEYTGGDNPQMVWSLDLGGVIGAYRSHRWTSLYPGVTWTSAVTPQRAKLPPVAVK